MCSVVQQRREAGFDRLGRIGRRGRHLEVPQRAAGRVVQGEVGERAADVEADAIHARSGACAPRLCVLRAPRSSHRFTTSPCPVGSSSTASPRSRMNASAASFCVAVAGPAVVVEHDHSTWTDRDRTIPPARPVPPRHCSYRHAGTRCSAGATSASTSRHLAAGDQHIRPGPEPRRTCSNNSARAPAAACPRPRHRKDRTGRKGSTADRAVRRGSVARPPSSSLGSVPHST